MLLTVEMSIKLEQHNKKYVVDVPIDKSKNKLILELTVDPNLHLKSEDDIVVKLNIEINSKCDVVLSEVD